MSAQQRLASRGGLVAPPVAELEIWMRATCAKLSRHSDVAKAIDYMLKGWGPSPASSTTTAFG
jgi:transposase